TYRVIFSRVAKYKKSLENKSFIVAKHFVPRRDDLFTRLESFRHLIITGILFADFYFSPESFGSVGRQHVYPLSPGALVKSTSGNQYRFVRRTELQVQMVRLSRPDIRRDGSRELQ